MVKIVVVILSRVDSYPHVDLHLFEPLSARLFTALLFKRSDSLTLKWFSIQAVMID